MDREIVNLTMHSVMFRHSVLVHMYIAGSFSNELVWEKSFNTTCIQRRSKTDTPTTESSYITDVTPEHVQNNSARNIDGDWFFITLLNDD